MDTNTVLEFVRQVLGVEALSAERITLSHSGNTIFEVALPDRSVIVRLREDEQDTFGGTVGNIESLKQLGLPVPQVIAAGTSRVRFPFAYVLLEKISGRDLLYELDSMTLEQITRLAEQIVAIEQQVGTLPQGTGYSWGNIGGGGTEPVWFDILEENSEPPDFTGRSFAELHRRLYAARVRRQPYFRRIEPICFLEDLTTKNVILQNGELQGIIDFDSVCFGDPLWQVGLAAGCILNDVGTHGLFYIEELCRIWDVTSEQRKVIAYYSAQRALEFLDSAHAEHNATLIEKLVNGIDQLLACES